MNINFNLLSNYSIFFFKENVLPILTAQQKKIIAIASIALGCFATYSFMRYFCFKVQISEESKEDEDFYSNINLQKGSHSKTEGDSQIKAFSSPKKGEETLVPLQQDKGMRQILHLESEGYQGEVKEGKPHGRGKMTSSSGTIYEGEFKEGKLSGQGKVTFSNGAIGEGEFKDGKLNGQGKITFSDGQIKEGQFKDDELNGQGKKIHSDKKVEEGEFKLDRLYSSIHPQIKISKPQFKFDPIPQIKSALPLTDYQNVLLDISDSLGPSPTGITESYVWYMRTLIFGFSIGQKRKMEEISSQSGIKLKEIEKILEGSWSSIHMVYIARHIDELISQLKSEKANEIDRNYIEALQNLQSILQRSLPIALMLYYVSHKNIKDQVLEQLTDDIYEELAKMKKGEQILIPIYFEKHMTLLAFQKMQRGTLQPILYNTGLGVDNHIKTDLNIESLIDHLNMMRHHYPLSINYSPIDLQSSQTEFKTMMRDLLKLKNEKIKTLYTILENTFGKGKKGPTRFAQINGVCSFQVLTEAFKNILGSKQIYNTYKLDLLTSIQEEFQEITDAMELLIDETDLSNDEKDSMKKIYKLHQILLQENQKQIDITEQVLAQSAAL